MKETAILMIADSVESASRTLKDHSQEELDGMINKIIQSKLNDGQLSDSPLTLKDLKTIAAALSKNLRAAHHQRIKYHENIIQELEEKALKKKFVAPDKITTDEEEKNRKKRFKNTFKSLKIRKNKKKIMTKEINIFIENTYEDFKAPSDGAFDTAQMTKDAVAMTQYFCQKRMG